MNAEKEKLRGLERDFDALLETHVTRRLDDLAQLRSSNTELEQALTDMQQDLKVSACSQSSQPSSRGVSPSAKFVWNAMKCPPKRHKHMCLAYAR